MVYNIFIPVEILNTLILRRKYVNTHVEYYFTYKHLNQFWPKNAPGALSGTLLETFLAKPCKSFENLMRE